MLFIRRKIEMSSPDLTVNMNGFVVSILEYIIYYQLVYGVLPQWRRDGFRPRTKQFSNALIVKIT